jgi:hypothetical protein
VLFPNLGGQLTDWWNGPPAATAAAAATTNVNIGITAEEAAQMRALAQAHAGTLDLPNPGGPPGPGPAVPGGPSNPGPTNPGGGGGLTQLLLKALAKAAADEATGVRSTTAPVPRRPHHLQTPQSRQRSSAR